MTIIRANGYLPKQIRVALSAYPGRTIVIQDINKGTIEARDKNEADEILADLKSHGYVNAEIIDDTL